MNEENPDLNQTATEQPAVVSAPPPVNPLLERARIPGETFTLPSQGLFYKNGELKDTVKNGEIYIYPMVTLDEVILKTPDKLFSGEAIIDVFKRCVPDVLKPMELLAKDVDYIIVCLRKLTYGNHMQVTYMHDCENAKDHEYNVDIDPFIRNSKRIDPSTLSDAYTLNLDNGQVLQLAPPRFGNVLKIYQAAGDDSEVNVDLIARDLSDTIVGMIQSVDGITDKSQIREWVDVIPAGWIHRIGESIEKVSDWGPDFVSTTKCKDCGKEMEMNTPVNPLAFFI